jgi:hypothetical protein
MARLSALIAPARLARRKGAMGCNMFFRAVFFANFITKGLKLKKLPQLALLQKCE